MVLLEAHGEGEIRPRMGYEESNEEARSHFLPGTQIQIAWDATSLEALKKCPRYYQYVMIDNWQGKGDAIHLRWGQEMGLTIDGYHESRAAGVPHDDAVHDTVRALLHRIDDWAPEPGTKSEERKSKENLVRTVVWYLDHYENDAAEVVKLANGKLAVELSFNFELGWGPMHTWEGGVGWDSAGSYQTDGVQKRPYLLCGHLDKVVRFSGDLFVMDHKTTTGTLGSYFFDNFNPHNQMSVYTIAGQTIMKSPIKGVIIDGIQVVNEADPERKKEPFFRRGITYRTPDQLEEWLDDAKRWMRQAERYAEEGHWPMNDTACSMYGGCRFRGVCEKSPQVRQKWLESGFTQENPRWNPLVPR
jgi:hypothetical protein